jgi:hypothetical protein
MANYCRQRPTHNLRNYDQFIVSYPRIELSKKSPFYLIPFEWNQLGGNRYQPSIIAFYIAIK